MKQITAVVRLGFPVTGNPSERTDPDGRYAKLTVEDDASGVVLLRLDMSPAEWMRVCATEMTRVSQGALTSDHLEQVGAQPETSEKVAVVFDKDQTCALRALLDLVHYDDLAASWRSMLPDDLLRALSSDEEQR